MDKSEFAFTAPRNRFEPTIPSMPMLLPALPVRTALSLPEPDARPAQQVPPVTVALDGFSMPERAIAVEALRLAGAGRQPLVLVEIDSTSPPDFVIRALEGPTNAAPSLHVTPRGITIYASARETGVDTRGRTHRSFPWRSILWDVLLRYAAARTSVRAGCGPGSCAEC